RPLDYVVWLTRAVRIPAAWTPYRPIPHPSDADRLEGKPRVFHGVIASANSLQKNPRRRDFLRTRFHAMAVEMEGSGVAAACYQVDTPYFIVRGTCDYCNRDKNNDWHNYAAIAAAAYTKALVEAMPLTSYIIGRES